MRHEINKKDLGFQGKNRNLLYTFNIDIAKPWLYGHGLVSDIRPSRSHYAIQDYGLVVSVKCSRVALYWIQDHVLKPGVLRYVS